MEPTLVVALAAERETRLRNRADACHSVQQDHSDVEDLDRAMIVVPGDRSVPGWEVYFLAACVDAMWEEMKVTCDSAEVDFQVSAGCHRCWCDGTDPQTRPWVLLRVQTEECIWVRGMDSN